MRFQRLGELAPQSRSEWTVGKKNNNHFCLVLLYPKSSACSHTNMYWSQDYVALGVTAVMRGFGCIRHLPSITDPATLAGA